MLSGVFFDIQSFNCESVEGSQTKLLVTVSLNDSHPIFTGHFPGNPVVPGVCQIQMIKELVEKAVKQQLRLTESDNIKFLSMISPLVNNQLEFVVQIKPSEERQIVVIASIGAGTTQFLKFKGKFQPAG